MPPSTAFSASAHCGSCGMLPAAGREPSGGMPRRSLRVRSMRVLGRRPNSPAGLLADGRRGAGWQGSRPSPHETTRRRSVPRSLGAVARRLARGGTDSPCCTRCRPLPRRGARLSDPLLYLLGDLSDALCAALGSQGSSCVLGKADRGKKWGGSEPIFSPLLRGRSFRLFEKVFQVLAVDGWQAGFGQNAAHESGYRLSPPHDTSAERWSRCELPGDRCYEQPWKTSSRVNWPAPEL